MPTLKMGVGVPCFSVSIPLLQKNWFLKSLPSLMSCLTPSSNKTPLAHWGNGSCKINSLVTSISEVWIEWENVTMQLVDIQELSIADIDPTSHDWLLHHWLFPRLYLRSIPSGLEVKTLHFTSHPMQWKMLLYPGHKGKISAANST